MLVFDISAGGRFEEVGEEVSIDQIYRQDWGNGVYIGGRWGGRWDSSNWCTNNGRGKVLNWDVFIEGEGGKQAAFNDVRGVVGDGRDGAVVLVEKNEFRGKVFVVDDGRVFELDNEIVEVVVGEFLGGNMSKDVQEGLVVNKRGRRAGDEDRGGGRGAGVSRGWEVPGVVGTVEKVLNFLGGSSEVGYIDVVNGRPIE